MSSEPPPPFPDFLMGDGSVSGSTDLSSMSTSEDISYGDSILSGHPDWLQGAPENLTEEMAILRSFWDSCPGWHESLNLLGRQIILGHVEKEKEREKERMNMEYAVKNAETAAWTYKAEFHDMRQKIFQLEVTIDNLRAVNMRNFDVEVRNRDLEDRLNGMTITNKELHKTNKDLEKAKTDLMQAIRGLRKELKKEQDRKTDFEDKFNMEQVAGRGNIERWLSQCKIHKMKAALGAAKAETAQWRKLSADIINGHMPDRPFPMFFMDPKLTRRQSF
jgi:hypothetical protein